MVGEPLLDYHYNGYMLFHYYRDVCLVFVVSKKEYLVINRVKCKLCFPKSGVPKLFPQISPAFANH